MPAQLLLGGDRRPADGRLRRGPARRSRTRASAGGWPSATSTTTAGSTPSIVAQNEPLVYFHNRTERAATS